MLERPSITDERITDEVYNLYGVTVANVSFLPWGYDLHTAAFKVEGLDGTAFFLKLRKGDFNPITVKIPQLLSQTGVKGIIPVLPTRDDTLCCQLDGYTLILYPYIAGKDGYHISLTEHQWTELGKLLRAIHTISIPAELIRQIPAEKYDPQWRETVMQLIELVNHNDFQDSFARKLSIFIKKKAEAIYGIVKRANELVVALSKHPRDFVLCHADAHPGNYHITGEGKVYLVDWDNLILAPKEHDLMCIGAGMSGDQPDGLEEKSFYQGYGMVKIDWQALTYYRYERIIQDIAEFGKQLLLTTGGGDDREQSFQYFVGSFLPGEVVEVAFQTDREHITRPVDKE